MKVDLVFKIKDSTMNKVARDITIKKAREYFKKHLKNNDNVTLVYMRYFDGWYVKLYKTLKGKHE